MSRAELKTEETSKQPKFRDFYDPRPVGEASSILLGALCVVERCIAVTAADAASTRRDDDVARLLDAISFHAELTASEMAGLAAVPPSTDAMTPPTLGELIVRSMGLVDRLSQLARADGHRVVVDHCEAWLDQRGRLVAAWSAALSRLQP